MKTKIKILLTCLLGSVFLSPMNAAGPEKETRYLAFQIFTYGPNPIVATMGEGATPQPARFPEKVVLRDFIGDIKKRIGTVGDPQNRLGVVLGHLAFDHGDAEVTKFIEMGFDLAIETDVAVGFHIDDSMFWGSRKDLISDPKNVEAMDWDGTPCTGRRLEWSKVASTAPPQMCFNSRAIQREVQQRAALIGKAIEAGVKKLQQLKRPELFAGVIAGSETQIGQDFKTGKYLGYRALLNSGFTREHPPKDMDRELENVTQEWIELWTSGLAGAGVSQQKIYSHIRFLSHRAFYGDDKDITYMKRQGDISYSQHNTYTPPPVAFGKHHRPGFSIYPQGGIFEDIYEELARHQQTGWASCEGTNMQPSSGPGQTGMIMETYLAKMFNHGATLVNVFAWGIGGEANRNIPFRIVTEGEESLQAYRKFLKGEPLVEGAAVAGLTDRLPPKIHKIQAELPAWMQKAENKDKAAEVNALMQKMMEYLKAKNFDEVEKTADSILKMMGGNAQPSTSAPATASSAESKPQRTPSSASPSDDPKTRLMEKVARVTQGVKKWTASGRDPSAIVKTMQEKFKPLMEAGRIVDAEAELDRLLEQLNKDPNATGGSTSPTPTAPTQAAQDIPEEVRDKLAHNLGNSFLLFRTKVQGELKVTNEQKEKLNQYLRALLPDAMQVLQKSKGEREKYNQKTHVERAAVLKQTLDESQRTRLHELELQKDLLFGPAWNMKELQITDEQQKQFMAPTQETQQKTQALMGEIQKGANPDAIRPKAFQLRLDLEVKLEALLTDIQKKQWKEMLGKPVDPGVIYGGL